MNPIDILKAINEFRGRKFLLVMGIGFLVYIGRIDQYWLGCAALVYFITDVIEKYIVHKSEEEREETNGQTKTQTKEEV